MDMTDKLTEFPEFPELKFDDEHHIYRLDGTIIPSVSSIMEPLSGAKYAGISGRTLEKAANKGTSVHNSIENFIKFGIEDVNPAHRGYFNAFREWWEKKQPELVGSECRIYHKILQYGGTIDLLAYIRGALTLVDFKSTYALSDMTCGVQLEAYAQALASHGIHVEQKMILQVKKDGKHVERSYPANDSQRWRVFGSLKCVYDYIQSYK